MEGPELATILLSVLEGEKLTPYRDTGGVWTEGIGHTGSDVKPDVPITHEQAIELFTEDNRQLVGEVLAPGAYSVLEQAGYISFGFNCGFSALKRVLAGQSQMSDFVHDRSGAVVSNLVRRRRLEQALITLGKESKK